MVETSELAILISAKDRASGALDKVGGKLGRFGKLAGIAKVGLLGVGAVGIGVAAGLFKIGADFDKAFDKIRIGTGASGEDFEKLKKVTKDVFKAIPTDLDKASDAITQFNTLTGATGPNLAAMAKAGLEAARLLGEDSAALIKNAGKAFNVFEIDAEDGAGALDTVFKASQASNVPMTQLLGTLQTYGPVLKNLGFGLAESTAFFASLEKAGIDVSRVMPGLNAFMRKLADEGVTDLSGALNEQIEQIKGAKTESEALNLATQAFGAEGAQRLSVAIRTGALDLADFTAELEKSDDAIATTAEETESLGEKFTRFKNTLLVAIQPLATGFFNGLTKVATLIEKKVIPIIGLFTRLFVGGFTEMDVTSSGFHGTIEKLGLLVRKVFNAAIPIVEDIRDAFVQFGRDALPHLIEFGEKLLEIGQAILPLIVDAIGTLFAAWKQLFEQFLEPVVLPILRQVIGFLLENKEIVIALLAVIILLNAPWLAVIAVLILVLAKWDEIKAVFTKTIPDAIKAFLDKVREIPVIGAIFGAAWDSVRIIVETAVALIKNRIETFINAVREVVRIVLALIRGDFGEAWAGIKALVGVIVEGIVNEVRIVLGGLAAIVLTQLQGVLDVIKDVAGLAATAAEDVGKKIVGGISDGIRRNLSFIRGAINTMIGLLESGLNFIIRAWNALEFALPKIDLGPLGSIGGGSIGTPNLGLINIPRLQRGAFIPAGVTTPAILHGPEAVIPLGGAGDDFAGSIATAVRDALAGMVVELDGEPVGRLVDSRIGVRADALMRGG